MRPYAPKESRNPPGGRWPSAVAEEAEVHEYSIACRLIEVVETEMTERGITERPTALSVVVGEMSGVVPYALTQAFPIAATGTVCEGARLDVESVPLMLHCRGCDHEWHAVEPFLICEECGGVEIDVLSGRELQVRSVEFGGDE